MKNDDKTDNHIAQTEDPTPYEFYSILLFAVISFVGIMSFESVLEFGAYWTAIFVVVLLSLIYASEVLIIRHENHINNITKMTDNQIIRNKISAIMMIIILVFSSVFNELGILYYAYPLILFMVAFSSYTTGLVLYKPYFTEAGVFGLIVSLFMFLSFLLAGKDIFDGDERLIAGCVALAINFYATVMLESGGCDV